MTWLMSSMQQSSHPASFASEHETRIGGDLKMMQRSEKTSNKVDETKVLFLEGHACSADFSNICLVQIEKWVNCMVPAV